MEKQEAFLNKALIQMPPPGYEEPVYSSPSYTKNEITYKTIIKQNRKLFSKSLSSFVLVVTFLMLWFMLGRCIYNNFVKTYFADGRVRQNFKIFDHGYKGHNHEDIERLKEEFAQFLSKHARSYNKSEEILRIYYYTQTKKEITALNKGTNKTVFEVNHFSDYTDEELAKFLIPHSFIRPRYLESAKSFRNAPNFDAIAFDQDYKRPESVDWRKSGAVTGIKNQGQCGSCWAFAIAAVVESQNQIFNNATWPLSEQEMMDCDYRDKGCGGGFRGWGFEFVKTTGLLPDQNYGYEAMVGKCRLPMEGVKRVYVDEIYSFDGDEDEMADWVANKGPITIGVNVTKGMFSYKSGVFDPTPEDCAQKSLGSHAMAVIGFGTENGEPYWLLKNSWGPAYGQSGYLKMKRGVDSCGFSRNVYTALITKKH